MTCTIQRHIIAVILAGALLLFAGLAVQTVYAADEYNADFTIDGISNVSCVLPGDTYNLHAILKQNGETIPLPDGATCEWNYGIMDAQVSKDEFTITYEDESHANAIITFPQLPEGMTDMTAWIGATIKLANGTEYTTDVYQFGVRDDYYDSTWPIIEGDLLKGQEVTQTASVTHYFFTEDGQVDSKVCEVDFKWENFPSGDLSKNNPSQEKDGSYKWKFKRLATENRREFSLTMSTKDGKWSETQWYNLYGFSTDLSKCNIMIHEDPEKHFKVYEDNWVFFDEQKVGNPGLTAADFHVISGDMTTALSADCFEVTELEKYIGTTENSDDAFKPTKFPLKFDPKGTKDRNGNRTDGTSLYHFTVKAKAGSGWTGKTDMFVFVNSKYSLYNFQDYFIGTVVFPSLAKYLKDWDKDPYMRYEVPKGNKAKKTLVVKLGNDKLTPGKQITVKYRNDKTKKEYSSFPTNKPGEYTLVITGKSPYYGKDTSTHLKIGMKNPLVVKGKTVKIKKKQIKKKAKTLKAKRVVKIKKKGKGKLTYKKLSGNKKITVASNGKVKVKKGLKKGTYKVKVSVTAAGNDQYFPITKKVTFKIKVKK